MLEPRPASTQLTPRLFHAPALAFANRSEALWNLGRRSALILSVGVCSARAEDNDALNAHVLPLGAVLLHDAEDILCGGMRGHLCRCLSRLSTEIRICPGIKQGLGADVYTRERM